jgi:tetratricopeptide (TPR) repeat protein
LHAYQIKRQTGALYRQALKAEEEGRPHDQVRYLQSYLSLNPEDTDALEKYGLALAQQAATRPELAQSHRILSLTVAREPNRHEARRRVAELAMQLRQFADAANHLQALRKQYPREADLAFQHGQCLDTLGDNDAAVRAYEEAIRLNPQQIDAYLRLASLLQRLARVQAAESVVNRLVQSNPEAPQAFLARATFYRETNALVKAGDDIRRALLLAPDDPEVLLLAADLAREERRPKDARKYLEHALTVAPSRPETAPAYLALAQVEMDEGRLDQAEMVLRKARQAVPDWPVFALLLGEVLLDQGKVDEALTVADQLRQYKNVVAYWPKYLDACLAYKREQWSEAIRLLEEIRPQVGPRSELAGRVDQLLAGCHQRRGEPDMQLDTAERAIITVQSRDPRFRAARAANLATLGRLNEALAEYRKLLPEMPAVGLQMVPLLLATGARLPPDQRQRLGEEIDQLLQQAAKAGANAVDVKIWQAEALTVRGQPDKAADLLAQACKDHADRVEVWLAQAGWLHRQGQTEQAAKAIAQAKARFPKRVEPSLAQAALLGQRRDDASRQQLQALADDLERFAAKDQAALLRALGAAQLARGDLREATRIWTDLAERLPQDVALRLTLLELALGADDAAAVQRIEDHFLKLEGSAGALVQYARACRMIVQAKKGHEPALDQADLLLGEVARRRPNLAAVRLRQANVLELRKKIPQAIDAYLQAIEGGERSPLIIRRTFHLLCQHKRFEQAMDLLRRMEQVNVLPADMSPQAAASLLLRGDTEQLLRSAGEAILAQSKDYRDFLWYGSFLSDRQEYPEAEQALRTAVQLGPQAPEAWVALVHTLSRSGKKEAVEQVIDQAQRAVLAEDRLLTLALCCEVAGRVQEASQHYDALLQAKPGDLPTWRLVVSFYLRSQQFAKAEPLARKLLEPDAQAAPADVFFARRALALVLASAGSYAGYQEARALVESVVQKEGATPENLLVKAHVLAAGNSRSAWREAIELMEQARKNGGSLPPAEEFFLASLHDRAGDWPRARAHFEADQAWASDPKRVAHYTRRLLAQGQPDQADRWLSKLEELAPQQFATAEVKARLLEARGEAAKAVEVLGAALGKEAPEADVLTAAELFEHWRQVSPAEALFRRYADQAKQPEARLQLASFLARQDRLDEALALCEAAWTSCQPDQVALTATVALVSTERTEKQCQRVTDQIRRAIQKHPKQAIVLTAYLGTALTFQGRYKEAEDQFREALKQDGHQLVALNNLAGQLALASGKAAAEEALLLINRALELVGPNAALLDTRAVIFLARGEPARAIQDLEEAVALAPQAEHYFHLAQAHLATNNRPQAEAAWKKMRELKLKPKAMHPLEQKAYQSLVEKLG